MSSSLKVRILYFLYALKAALYRCRGVRIGKGSFISGWPFIRKCRGAEIVLGDHVTVHSKKKYNALITHRATLSAEAPGAKIELHDYSGVSGCTLICTKRISIGKYTIIGAGTVIHDCKAHEYSPESGWSGCGERKGKDVVIGSRCYIGMNCIILKGVTIGDNSVVSAGSVIRNDVPPGHLAQGNPAVCTPLPERLTRVVESHGK